MPSDSAPAKIMGPSAIGCVGRTIEQAGKSYQLYIQKRRDLEKGVSEISDDSQEEKKDRNDDEESEFNADYEKKRHRRTRAEIEKEALELGDLYGILGLEESKNEVSVKGISKAYRKMAVKSHPDKLGEGELTEDMKKHWLTIQKAYDTLSDPAKRRKYDSSLPFDDDIPSEDEFSDDEGFYETFTKCFERNAVWSKKKPVPSMGDKNTPMEEVRKFYKFWDNFDSWREFSQYDEYHPEEATDRYERRYMENENRRGNKKHVRDEQRRVITMV